MFLVGNHKIASDVFILKAASQPDLSLINNFLAKICPSPAAGDQENLRFWVGRTFPITQSGYGFGINGEILALVALILDELNGRLSLRFGDTACGEENSKSNAGEAGYFKRRLDI
jgi:hypothetical protein